MGKSWTPNDPLEFKAQFLCGLSNQELKQNFGGIPLNNLICYITEQQELGNLPPRDEVRDSGSGVTSPSDLDNKLTKMLTSRQQVYTIEQLANTNKVSPRQVEEAVERLQLGGHLAMVEQGYLGMTDPRTAHPTDYYVDQTCGPTKKFGVVADTHLGSKYADESLLNDLYDIFEDEGITDVYHCGNWIEGDAKFNFNERSVFGFHAQLDYFLARYPSRKGITTHIIDGDDHEGWVCKSEGIVPGIFMEAMAKQKGREDLRSIGYMTHDIKIPAPNGYTCVRVEHPGGGSTKTVSGKLQSVIDSLPIESYPDIYLMGHYHKQLYLQHRGVHGFFVPCTCDQTPFMYKKLLNSVKGGLIIEFTQGSAGEVMRLKHEFIGAGGSRPWQHRK